MRTTLRIDDDLLRDLKRRAQKEKTSLAVVVNSLLRHVLVASRQPPTQQESYREKTFSMGPPKVDLSKALALAGQLEDEEILRKMAHHK